MENDDRLDINWIDIENPSQVYGNVTNKNIPDKEWPSSHEDVYGLKTAILIACNPARFMEPDYDVNKVSAAIEIYKKLKEVAPYDMETLGILRKDAEKALNIRMDTNAFYHHLIKMFSPKRYVVNYQEDLLTKSHEIILHGDSISKLIKLSQCILKYRIIVFQQSLRLFNVGLEFCHIFIKCTIVQILFIRSNLRIRQTYLNSRIIGNLTK